MVDVGLRGTTVAIASNKQASSAVSIPVNEKNRNSKLAASSKGGASISVSACGRSGSKRSPTSRPSFPVNTKAMNSSAAPHSFAAATGPTSAASGARAKIQPMLLIPSTATLPG